MSSYAAAHDAPKGPGDGRPTATQIIGTEGLEGKWTEKTILITGCSSGLGVETARALAKTGATLYLTARDVKKAKVALGNVLDRDNVHLLTLDLSSLESVKACAADFLSRSSSLNILIENAGVMAPPEGRTKEGFETQFGTNHLGHFLLFLLLKPVLLASSTPEFHSRVVILSSSGHRDSEVNFENINLEGEYHPLKAYGQSKTANLWTANHIERKYGTHGLHAFSVHPGLVMTDLMRHIPRDQVKMQAKNKDLISWLKTPEQGAATTVWAAVSASLESFGGKYLEDCHISKPYREGTDPWGPGYAPWAYDNEKEAKLWSLSLRSVGMDPES
ncbi:short-chain dehydrogenase [Aspergillus terreus]|uniref:Short-chain dehydrogenase n=1 Tax=Aspergillus terreus TaxID=33178 RepID=A0A5M3ZB68_ASPTE|nr:hypothetical protein ATETN484_0013032900 [Aspergillus terreus]GFF20563.1 short-chain dehydrogenase [Aspergillus terreus]